MAISDAASRLELHNVVSAAAIHGIAGDVLSGGGSAVDVLIVLESVVSGVLLVVVKPGGEENVLDMLKSQVMNRMELARQQLAQPPDGQRVH